MFKYIVRTCLNTLSHCTQIEREIYQFKIVENKAPGSTCHTPKKFLCWVDNAPPPLLFLRAGGHVNIAFCDA